VPYLKQVAGLLLIGSFGGIVMNMKVILPAILLDRAIDVASCRGRKMSATEGSAGQPE
jgi:hypothetical protein